MRRSRHSISLADTSFSSLALMGRSGRMEPDMQPGNQESCWIRTVSVIRVISSMRMIVSLWLMEWVPAVRFWCDLMALLHGGQRALTKMVGRYLKLYLFNCLDARSSQHRMRLHIRAKRALLPGQIWVRSVPLCAPGNSFAGYLCARKKCRNGSKLF